MGLKNLKAIKVAPDATAPTTWSLSAGTSDVLSQVVDMGSHQAASLSWIVDAGAIAALGGLGAIPQECNDLVTWVDVPGASASISFGSSDDDKRCGVTLERISKRYQRLAIFRLDAGNSSMTLLQAILEDVRMEPVVQLVTAGQFISQPASLAP